MSYQADENRLLLEKQKLIDISIALTSERDLNRLLFRIITELRQLTAAQGGSLYLVEGDFLKFEIAQNEALARSFGSDYLCFKYHEIPINQESIAGYAALTGKVLTIEDVYHLPEFLPCHFDPSFDRRNNYRTQAMLAAPLKDHRGEVVGVLQLINPVNESGEIRPFSAEDETLVLALASQAAVAINNVRLLATIKNLFEALMVYSVSAIDARSPHTAGHSRRVAAYSLALARGVNECRHGPLAEVSFSDPELEELRFSAWLHDIGKIGVRDALLDKNQKLSADHLEAIRWRFYLAQMQAGSEAAKAELEQDFLFIQEINRLNYLPAEAPERLAGIAAKRLYLKEDTHPLLTEAECQTLRQPLLTPEELTSLLVLRGNLTPQEYAEIQGHALQTLNILEKIPFSKHLARVPRFAAGHHERLDGSGYPFHLTAAELPYQTRILAIADIFDALTSTDRPYRSSYAYDKAAAVLQEEAARGRLDQDLVELFVSRRLYEDLKDLEREAGQCLDEKPSLG
ncbi:MAG: GAF domain-containing protein [Deltaproteobacteria bacterium]|nr:GAF domain-containing protein [Deltaproteobacteria bacterium]